MIVKCYATPLGGGGMISIKQLYRFGSFIKRIAFSNGIRFNKKCISLEMYFEIENFLSFECEFPCFDLPLIKL